MKVVFCMRMHGATLMETDISQGIPREGELVYISKDSPVDEYQGLWMKVAGVRWNYKREEVSVILVTTET